MPGTTLTNVKASARSAVARLKARVKARAETRPLRQKRKPRAKTVLVLLVEAGRRQAGPTARRVRITRKVCVPKALSASFGTLQCARLGPKTAARLAKLAP